MPEKNPKVKLGLKNLALLPSYFDYIFMRVRQKARHRPELSSKFLLTLGPNRPEKTDPTYNSVIGVKYTCVFRLVLRCFFAARKKNLTGVSIGLTDQWKNLYLTCNPTDRSNRPVSISGLKFPNPCSPSCATDGDLKILSVL